MHASLIPSPQGLEFRSSYDRALIAQLKTQIPYSGRRPIYQAGKFSHWLIDPQFGKDVAEIVQQTLGIAVQVPAFGTEDAQPETRLLRVEYLGRCKERGDDMRSAYGYVDGAWSVIFPEDVLKRWFDAIDQPDDHPTLYGVLGIR